MAEVENENIPTKWWQTIPAILMGIAAVITALVAFIPIIPPIFTPQSDDQWYGYYGDVTDNKPYVTREDITLPIKESEHSFSGSSSGRVRLTKEESTKRSWDFSGFLNTDYLVSSYLTKSSKSDPIPRGIGSYFLEKYGNNYIGTITARQSKKIITMCPYVLSKEDITDEEATKKWPGLLECKEIYFPNAGVVEIKNVSLSTAEINGNGAIAN